MNLLMVAMRLAGHIFLLALVLHQGVSMTSAVEAGPALLSTPTNRIVFVGSDIQFDAVVGGSEPISHQWFKDGLALPGANTASLTLTNVQLSDQGQYAIEM